MGPRPFPPGAVSSSPAALAASACSDASLLLLPTPPARTCAQRAVLIHLGVNHTHPQPYLYREQCISNQYMAY